MSWNRSSRTRTLALVVAGAAAVATLVALRRRALRLLQEAGEDPCGPDLRLLPEGRSLVVTTTDGVELATTVAGPDDAPTVVLSHCWTGSREVWAAVGRRLLDAGHRVVMYDQRGHGHSTLGDQVVTIDGLGEDLKAVLEATDARDALLVGHSMGGMTIQSYASLHPEHFADHTRGVVLVATAARVLGRTVPAPVVDRFLGDGRMEWSRRGRVGRRVVRGALGTVARPEHVDLTLDLFAATVGPARAGFLTAMAAMDLRAGLGQIGVPTTVVVGTRDLLTPPRLGRQLADSIPGAELVVLPGKGHMLPIEAPVEIVAAIESTDRRARVAGGATATTFVSRA